MTSARCALPQLDASRRMERSVKSTLHVALMHVQVPGLNRWSKERNTARPSIGFPDLTGRKREGPPRRTDAIMPSERRRFPLVPGQEGPQDSTWENSGPPRTQMCHLHKIEFHEGGQVGKPRVWTFLTYGDGGMMMRNVELWKFTLSTSGSGTCFQKFYNRGRGFLFGIDPYPVALAKLPYSCPRLCAPPLHGKRCWWWQRRCSMGLPYHLIPSIRGELPNLCSFLSLIRMKVLREQLQSWLSTKYFGQMLYLDSPDARPKVCQRHGSHVYNLTQGLVVCRCALLGDIARDLRHEEVLLNSSWFSNDETKILVLYTSLESQRRP
ncbi:hypothetical protein V8F20_005067 [Naviculisporaceae sp. PSN 640]